MTSMSVPQVHAPNAAPFCHKPAPTHCPAADPTTPCPPTPPPSHIHHQLEVMPEEEVRVVSSGQYDDDDYASAFDAGGGRWRGCRGQGGWRVGALLPCGTVTHPAPEASLARRCEK